MKTYKYLFLMFLYQEGRTEAHRLKLLSHKEEMDILVVQVEN